MTGEIEAGIAGRGEGGAPERGGLVGHAARALEKGPVHTLELARRVLGLEGNPGAASAAVFTLLGTDERFTVSGDGVWSLEHPFDPSTPRLRDERYAVVDVETTGGSYGRGHRITEIAIVEVRNGIVDESFQTLINPGRRIPPRIARLTGITDAMVAGAPYFDQVADQVLHRLRGRVFVAHNVRFDWGFVSRQLAEALGRVPEGRRICTVQLTRRLVPELRRRNLDAVTAHYGVEIHDRHRASGDALATARVLLRLLDRAESRGIGTLATLERFLSGGWKEDRGTKAGEA